jgi:hypothetical protein
MKHLFSVLLLSLIVSSAVLAQDTSTDNMTILMDKIKADKKLLVAENMGLTEAESKAFWPVYDEYQKELAAGQMKYGNLVKRYAEKYKSMTNEEAQALLNDYMKMEEDLLKTRQSFVPKLRKVLPEIKVVRYMQIENKIRSAINYELASMIPLMK